MLKSKIHLDTTVEGDDFSFICPAGCQTVKAYQAADEFRSYLFGKMKEQEEQQKASAESLAEQPKG